MQSVCRIAECVAVCALQCAVCCSVLQSVCCSLYVAMCSVLHCMAVCRINKGSCPHCSVLQCVAVLGVLQCTAVWSVLQCVAVCCSVARDLQDHPPPRPASPVVCHHG